MVQVSKANGKSEPFQEEKVIRSIQRSGIPKELHQKVLAHVKQHLYENIPTSEIYHHIREFLGKSSHPFAKAKYSLKQGIMELGPTGFPFEDYISFILQKDGFTTQTRQIVQGTCISHEIDVIATKHTVLPNKRMVEAKFHNSIGIQTDVHVSMYTKARFDDIKEKNTFTEVMLVTNTKITTDALAYAQCVGMYVMSWSYPEGESLRDKVEQYALYPITALTTLPRIYKTKLLEKDIVLCSQLCKNEHVLDTLGMDKNTKETVMREASFVCSII